MSGNVLAVPASAMPARDGAEALGACAGAPRRIVLVGPLPPPSGGMANQTQQLAALLASEGCQVTVVQSNRAVASRIERLRVVRAAFRLVPFVVRLWRAMRGAEVVHVMANSGWAWHLFAAPAVWMAALSRVPVVVNYRGGSAEQFLRRQVGLVRPTLARAALLVVPSGYLRAVFSGHGIAAVIVPNVVNLERFSPAATLPTHPHLLVTRNLERIYGIETAIRAFALVCAAYPEARLTVAGSGPERAALEALACDLGVAARIRFTGRLDNASLPHLYRDASIALNPSRVDNMPNSLLEAMASGVPIVSTDVGGIPYVVEDGRTALLVPPVPERMAEALLRLIRDPSLAKRLREEALMEVTRYSWHNVRPVLFNAYVEAASARGRS